MAIITSALLFIPLYLEHGKIIIFPTIIIIPLSVVVGALFVISLIIFNRIAIRITNHLIDREFPEFIKHKIQEISVLLASKKKIKLTKPIRFNCYNIHNHHTNSLKLLGKFICVNQGELAQFIYIAGEKHKNIKEEYLQVKNNFESGKTHIHTKKLAELCAELKKELYDMIAGRDKIYDKCSNEILNYFGGRSKYGVRICVKAQKDRNGNIFDYYRHGWSYSSEEPIPYSENTGCEEVLKKGRYYICSDIPGEIKNNLRYVNPRIDIIKVREYLKEHGEIKNHRIWSNFWSPLSYGKSEEKTSASPESCYMSTLIIPMTLTHNEGLTDDFKEHFELLKHNDHEMHRTIWALLCFDHVEKNFFVEEIDIIAGYMFADIMALYYINYLMYVNFSKTFKNAEILINNIRGTK